MDLPGNLDLEVDEVEDSWIAAIRFDTTSNWFGVIEAIMNRYCQYWRSSASLADCAPNKSSAGAILCTAQDNNVFDPPLWIAQTGNHSSNQHGDVNQVGHCAARDTATLTFNATTGLSGMPDAHSLAGITYNHNLLGPGDDPDDIISGEFWKITPQTFRGVDISVYQGVFSSIGRDYHSDSRIYSEHR